MKNCDIVKDLLPLYAEELASEESAAFVKEHLEECESCRAALDALKAPVEPPEPAAPLRTVRRAVKKRGWLIAGMIACLVAALFFTAIARLLKPIPIHSAENAFDWIEVSVPERVKDVVPEAYYSYRAEENLPSVPDEEAFVSVKPETFLVIVSTDRMILRDEYYNSHYFSLMENSFPSEMSDKDQIPYDTFGKIASEHHWLVSAADLGDKYLLEVTATDRLIVEMRAPRGTKLQIEYGNGIYTSGEVSSDTVYCLPGSENADADHVMTVCAYTTRLQQLIEKLGLGTNGNEIITFSADRDDLDAIVFEPYDNTEHEVLYQEDGYTLEAGFALPRLVMNYYFLIALAGTVILGVVWLVLLLTKKKAARRVFDVLLIIAGSFTLAFLAAGFPATTIAPGRELIFVGVIVLLLIGAGLCGRGLLRKE